MGREEKGKEEKQRKIERRQNQKDTAHIVQLNRSPPVAPVRKIYRKNKQHLRKMLNLACECERETHSLVGPSTAPQESCRHKPKHPVDNRVLAQVEGGKNDKGGPERAPMANV